MAPLRVDRQRLKQAHFRREQQGDLPGAGCVQSGNDLTGPKQTRAQGILEDLIHAEQHSSVIQAAITVGVQIAGAGGDQRRDRLGGRNGSVDVAVHVPSEIESTRKRPALVGSAQDRTLNADRHRIRAVLGIEGRREEEHAIDVRRDAVHIKRPLGSRPIGLAWRIEEVAPLVQHRFNKKLGCNRPPALVHGGKVGFHLARQIRLIVDPAQEVR
jgi:hypothetical protein